MRLVFHEYLWTIGIDDTNYQWSRLLATRRSTPAIDTSTPLVIKDTVGAATYNIFWTDQVGNYGNYQYTAPTGAMNFWLNPGRKIHFDVIASAATICYDRRLSNNFSWNNQNGVIHWCVLNH